MQGNMLSTKRFDALAQARRVFGFTLLNKPPQRAQMKIALSALFATATEQRRNAQAAVPYRAGQRHVEQAQILRQTFGLCQLNAGLRVAEIEHRLERLAIVVKSLILHAVIGDKRQPDQRIFQAFRLVDGDDLHQMFITLEAHLLAGGIAVRIGNLLRQPAHQGMLALQLRTRLLQEFADV